MALSISNDNPLVNGTPVEQVVITNPNGFTNTSMSILGFGVNDGTSVKNIGWVGVTAGSFTFGPYPNATFLENFSTGGIVLLSDHPTNGTIDLYSGGYTSTTFRRMRINPSGVVIYGIDGTINALNLQQTANNSNTAKSFIPLNFYNQNTLTGQLFSTSDNYNNNGTINIGPNSIGLLVESIAGTLLLAAAGTAGIININTGGYTSANTRFSIAANGDITQTNCVLTKAPPTVSTGQIGFGNTIADASLCSGASTGCLIINVEGVTRYIPYY